MTQRWCTALFLLMVANVVCAASWDDDSHYFSLGQKTVIILSNLIPVYFTNLVFTKRLLLILATRCATGTALMHLRFCSVEMAC